ncbi:radical SAM protein [Streptomyces sp. G2]|uniref:radical SAM protein n=1 Tax=Streptomyces sp. G2 TaxID=1684471 RepID=UPI00202F20CA|nr:radical SAM protein [Streptomyces sp. G2]MCM1950385.1 radical SAM protein [Streptomyces sp. G2]
MTTTTNTLTVQEERTGTPQLVASPFLAQYLLLRPGQASGVRIPEARYEELATVAREGLPLPSWVSDAAGQAWGITLPGTPADDILLVRERSAYGYGRASWEINLGCDYDCDFCYLPEKKFSGLDWAEKQRLLQVMQKAGVLWLQITGGEALIDRKFGAAYVYAHQLGMMVQVSTNGSSLRKPQIRALFARHRPYRLTVSVYGATAATYDKVTKNRGAFDRWIKGLDAAREDGLPVRLNVIVSDDNAHEVDAMATLARSYGFHHEVFTNMSPTIDGGANPLAFQSYADLKPRSVFTGCNAGRTFFHVNPHGIASVCKVGRDPNVNLVTEGVEALTRLGVIAESLQLRTGGCSGCTKVGTCRTCRPLAKLYQEAGDRRELYCQHGGYGS